MAVPKATTIKEAVKRFEDRFKCNAIEAKEVQLQFQWPPIEKMDPQLGTLVKCEWVFYVLCGNESASSATDYLILLSYRKLSLSTNMVDKITGLNGMRNLKILSIGRNYIKTISGLVFKRNRTHNSHSVS